MKVFFAPSNSTKDFWHLVVSSGWEKSTEYKESTQFNQLMVMRVQLFCEDVGRLRYRHEKFTIVPYDKEKHLKKMCLACVLKAKKSKRYGPQVSETSA